jgi:peptide/nickel transport system substrate-binding protein
MEPHFHTPFMHWMAAPLRTRMLSFSLRRRFRRMSLESRRLAVESINLLSRREVTTLFPDSMFLRRLCFSQIYPKHLLERGGRDAVRENPIGTGAYVLERWTKGLEIVLRRNEQHWAQRGGIDRIRIPILRQKNWVSALLSGHVDIALGIDVHDKVRIEHEPELATFSSDAAISHFFQMKHHGPLADLRVRRALNHAVHRQLIVQIAEHGYGRPQQSIATRETFGHAPDVRPYVYSPELAQRMLTEAGYHDGFRLRGLVSETSTAVYHAVKEFLGRIHVEKAELPKARSMFERGLETEPQHAGLREAMAALPR